MIDPFRLDNQSRKLLEKLLRRTDLRVFCKDLDSRFFASNDSFLNDTGVDSMSNLVGKNDYDLPWEVEESAYYRSIDREVIAKKVIRTVVEELTDHSRVKKWIETTKAPLIGLDGNTVGLIGYYQIKTL